MTCLFLSSELYVKLFVFFFPNGVDSWRPFALYFLPKTSFLGRMASRRVAEDLPKYIQGNLSNLS